MAEDEPTTPPPAPRRRGGKLTPDKIARAERDAEAIRLRNANKTFPEIADILGMSGKGTAHKAVQRGMARWAAADVEQLRAGELARTDVIIDRLWPLIDTDPPDLVSLAAFMKILDYRARIIGLFAPQAHKVQMQIDQRVEQVTLDAADLLSRRPDLAAIVDETLEVTGTEVDATDPDAAELDERSDDDE